MVQMNSQDSESSLPSQHCMSILQWALHGGVPPLIERGYEEDDSNVTASKFDHGQSNPTYLITIQSSRYPRREDCFRFVLRARPKGRLLPGAHRIDREFKVLASLRASPVPVPQVYGYCDDPTIIGSTFYAMEYIPGRIFKDASLREVASPKERAEIYREAVRVLCSLGELDTAKLGLRDLSKGPRPWIDRQISTWNRQFLASRIPGVDYRLMEALHRRLLHARQNQGKGEFTRAENHHGLVHGDYRLDNLIFHPEKPICIGVLDWELVSLGDPVADLATFLAPYHMPPEASSFEILRSATFPQPRPSGIPDELSLIRLYAKEVDERPFRSKLQLYLAVALFRFAAIIYGVQSRAAQGNASSSLGAKLGEHAHLYAQGAIVALDEISSLDNANSIESSSLTTLVARMWDFMKQEVLPLENKYLKHTRSDARWTPWEPLEILKGKAKTSGLWNLFLPRELGGSLSSSDYAALAEITGQCLYAAEVFNCSAPDTGNMELLARFGTLEQKQKWLQPLLKGKIRSCFAMTEPDVASSDATNLKTSIQRIGESYSVNGRKWWTSGAMDQRCKVILLIGRGPISNAENKHGQHTIVLIPTSTPGVKIHRHLEVFGFDDAPHGHAEMSFTNVIVDAKQALLHTEGGGFEAAQSRLGGGRLHHCMRLVGVCERAQTLTLERIHMRSAFNKLLAKNDAALQQIAQNRCHIESMRSATRRAAEAVDSGDVRDARKMVGVAKILVPRLACDVLDSCIQLHGGMGMCQDTLLSVFYSHARSLRIADGPDEVHLYALARSEVGAYRKSKL